MKLFSRYWVAITAGLVAMIVGLCGVSSQQSIAASNDQTAIRIDKVPNLSSGFIMGADTSTLISEENSGVKYYDLDGQQTDLLTILHHNGVNYIRVRVWNDPFNAKGQGYGAGNADIDNAITIGQRATKLGMKVLVDFHYSDFWADPGRQIPPKAWQKYNVDQKAQAIYDFTTDSLTKLRDSGVDVGMVQVGNETTGSGICGVTGPDEYKLFAKGAQAIRNFDKNIKIALHFTNPEKKDTILGYAQGLAENKIDYDVFTTSYYPYYHGQLSNLTDVLKTVADTYNKQVMVAETSYPYTLDDTDGEPNVIKTTSDVQPAGYPATPQGQAHELRDVINAVSAVGPKALGVFYWEPAWISVGGTDRTTNLSIWEKYGSGWASSAVIGYDPTVTTTNYGGSQWDNQALFDAKGHALQSLRTFKAVYTGINEQLPDPMLPQPSMTVKSLLKNPSFEDSDMSMYQLKGNISLSQNNPKTGKNDLDFYGDDDYQADASQTITLDPGTYTFSPNVQGGATNALSKLNVYVEINGQRQAVLVPPLTGWKHWVEPKLTFTLAQKKAVKLGLAIQSNAKSWGSTDDWILTRVASDTEASHESASNGNVSDSGKEIISSKPDSNSLAEGSQSSVEGSKSGSTQMDTKASIKSAESKSPKKTNSDKSLPKTGETILLTTSLLGVLLVLLGLVGLVIHYKQKAKL